MAYNGIYGTSVNHYGAFFKGDRTAIEIGESEYTGGDDVQLSEHKSINPEVILILVSNDYAGIFLDDDENSTEYKFEVHYRDNQIMSLDKNGNMTIEGVYSPSSDRNH